MRGDMKEILSTVRGMLSGLPVIVSGPKLSDAITVAVLDLIQSGHADLAVQLILDCPKRVSTLALFDSSVLSLCRPFSNPCWSSLRSPAEVRPLLQHATTVFHRACALGHLLTPTSLHTFGAAVCMHTPDLFLSAWPAFRLVFDFGGGRLKSPLTTTVADAAMLSFAMAASKAVGKTRDALTHFAMLRDRLADDSVSSVDRSVVSAVVWCLLFTGRPVPSLAFDFWRLVESRTVLAVGDGDMLGQLGVSLLQIGDRPSLRSLIMNHTPAHLLLSVAEAAMPSTPVARACHVRLADALLRSSVTVDRIPLSSLVPILVRLGNVYLTGVLQRLAHSLAIEDWLFAQEVAQVALESPRLNPGQSGLLAIMSSSHVDWNSNAFLPFLEVKSFLFAIFVVRDLICSHVLLCAVRPGVASHGPWA